MNKDEIHARLPLMEGNKLTPCIETVHGNDMPKAYWLAIDIGIWHDRTRPPHLSIMVYFPSGRNKYPPAGRLDALEAVHSRIKDMWKHHACPKCDGKEGGCADCGYTGWARCMEWLNSGAKMIGDRAPVFSKTTL
jgi:hypothetical protein